jgi:hypothetical protein
MFSRKKRAKDKANPKRRTGSFPRVPFTREHAAILKELNLPWFAALDPANAGMREAALRNALRSVTEAQMAEFVFIVSRPAAESKAVLALGRRTFTEDAMDYALKFICRADLQKIVADDAPLVVAATHTPSESHPNSN